MKYVITSEKGYLAELKIKDQYHNILWSYYKEEAIKLNYNDVLLFCTFIRIYFYLDVEFKEL